MTRERRIERLRRFLGEVERQTRRLAHYEPARPCFSIYLAYTYLVNRKYQKKQSTFRKKQKKAGFWLWSMNTYVFFQVQTRTFFAV